MAMTVGSGNGEGQLTINGMRIKRPAVISARSSLVPVRIAMGPLSEFARPVLECEFGDDD